MPEGLPASHRQPHTVITWVLILGFLCQPVLAYLATPMQVTDRNGFHAVVCTLKGTRQEVYIDLPSIAAEQASQTCSAIELFQLAGTTQIALPPVPPAPLLYLVAVQDQTADHQRRRLHFSAYASRAPPLQAFLFA